jgi:hypothetical protein
VTQEKTIDILKNVVFCFFGKISNVYVGVTCGDERLLYLNNVRLYVIDIEDEVRPKVDFS